MRKTLSAVLFLVACAEGNLERVSANDPRSRTAPEAAVALPSTTTSVAPGSSTNADTLYTCPMHPEVISHEPGKCPKCGMALVPKKP